MAPSTGRLDHHPVDLQDLVTEEADQVVAGQPDTELVHDHAVLPLQDVDGDDVPAHRADPAGHGAEGTGPIGKLDPDQVVGHRLRVGRDCVRTVSDRLRHPAN